MKTEFMDFEKLGLGKIRVLEERGVHGYFQFVFSDICHILGISITNGLKVVKEEGIEKYVDKIIERSNSANRHGKFERDFEITVLEEPALYHLIFSSNKPKALEFQLWMFTVVIPALRTHGAYLDRKKREEIQNDPVKIDEVLGKIRDLDEKIEAGKKELSRLQKESEKFDKSSDEYKDKMWRLFDKLVEMGEDPNELFDEM